MKIGVLVLVGATLLAACDTASSSTIGSTATPPVELTTTSLRTDAGGASGDPDTTSQDTTTSGPDQAPAVANDRLVIANENGVVYCFGKKKD